MSTFKLLVSEIAHRRTNFALSVLAIMVAAALFVASPALLRAYQQQSQAQLAAISAETQEQLSAMQTETDQHLAQMQEESKKALGEVENRTKRIMRDMGFNLRIVHRNTDLSKLYANFVSFDMPEEYIDRLANAPELTKVAHLVATIKQMIDWEDEPRLLVGIAPETPQPHIEKKPPMGYQIPPGEVFLGAISGAEHAVGDTVEILGSEFKVANILPANATRDEDIAIFMHLDDAQRVLDKGGKITEIVAIGCKCKTIDRVEEIQAQLELVLPEAKVMEVRNLAIAREDQRKLISEYYSDQIAKYKQDRATLAEVEQNNGAELLAAEEENHAKVLGLLGSLTGVVTPLVVLASALWIGLLAWSNVRERRTEIGLLRALGKGASAVATLFLGKAVVLGLVGGAIGCFVGILLERYVSQSLFQIAPAMQGPNADLIVLALLGAPLVAAMASYLPAIIASRQDPAVVLMDE